MATTKEYVVLVLAFVMLLASLVGMLVYGVIAFAGVAVSVTAILMVSWKYLRASIVRSWRGYLDNIFETSEDEMKYRRTHQFSLHPHRRIFSYLISVAPNRDKTAYPPILRGIMNDSYLPPSPVPSMLHHYAYSWWSPTYCYWLDMVLYLLTTAAIFALLCWMVTIAATPRGLSDALVVCPHILHLREACESSFKYTQPYNFTHRVEVAMLQAETCRYTKLLDPEHYRGCFYDTGWYQVLDWCTIATAIAFLSLAWYCFKVAHWYEVEMIPFPGLLTPGLATRIRDIAISVPLPPHGARHTHPLAAASRNAADRAISGFIIENGYEPYCIQMSPKDVAQGYAGSLQHIWPGTDTHAPERADLIQHYHYLKFINVDYYVDWVDYLWTSSPIIMYTFTPKVPCGTYQETSWTVKGDEFVMTIAGGATYAHKLWNYNVDSFEAVYPGVTIVYAVERVAVNEHWSIVTMTPKSHFRNDSITSYITLKRILPTQTILALDGMTREVAMLRDHLGNLKLSLPGQFVSISMSPELQIMLKARSRKAIAFADLVVILQADYGADCRLAQAIVYECFPTSGGVPSTISILEAQNVSISYRKVGSPALEVVEKLSATVLCPAVIDSAFAPMRCKANDEWCIDKRITSVHNPQRILGGDYSARYMGYAQEFIRLLVPIPHQHSPKEITEIIDSQTRPTQRLNNARAAPRLAEWLANEEMECKSFQKGEIYSAPKDPRNISTLPTEHCLVYSTYMQVVASILKTTKWYAFGLHPDNVAERVHQLAARALTLTETDFSRFDGTHSYAFYEHLELALLLRIFHPSHHNTITTVHRMMCEAQARTSWGVKYDPAGSRFSGAADTSAANSIDNAYVNFCAFRRMGCTPRVAYDRLGFYGGDDGVTPDVDGPMLERVVRDLGLSLKARARKPWQSLSFLGRIYTCPSAGPQHCADLPRQLAKLHVHPSARVEKPRLALFNKALGHSVTDFETPVLSAWSRMILRTCSEKIDDRYTSYSYKQYPTGISPRYRPTRNAMLHYAVEALGVTEQDIVDYERKLDQLTGPEQLTPLVPTVRPLPVPGVIIGNELVVSPTQRSITISPTQSKPSCLNGTCEHRTCHVVSPLRSIPQIHSRESAVAYGESKRETTPAVGIKPCLAFAKGQCKRTACKYSHDAVVLDHVCKDFLRGKCTRTKCKFKHPPSTSPPLPVNATPALT